MTPEEARQLAERVLAEHQGVTISMRLHGDHGPEPDAVMLARAVLALCEQVERTERDLRLKSKAYHDQVARAHKAEGALREKKGELAVAYGGGDTADESEWFSALDRAKAALVERDAEIQRIRAVVDEQAEDEALWAIHLSGQQPIAEAYLQQELRRLHAVVEAAGEGDT